MLPLLRVLVLDTSGPREGHERRKILMDSHPYTCYSHETSIFTLGAPHEQWEN